MDCRGSAADGSFSAGRYNCYCLVAPLVPWEAHYHHWIRLPVLLDNTNVLPAAPIEVDLPLFG